jgi:hypothetical protein
MNPHYCFARAIGRDFLLPLALLALLALAACSKDDPQKALDAAADELQAALEAKSAGRVLDLLHPEFSARASGEDAEWAKRTMAMMFMRYRNVTIVVPYRNNRLDPRLRDRAATDAEVTLLGAEGLLPDDARHYRVRLEWALEEKKWKLIRLAWE